MHTDTPPAEYRPDGQGTHPDPPNEKLPAGHTTQALDDDRDHHPGGHVVHDDDDDGTSGDAKVPSGHGTQAAKARNDPGGHTVHDDDPGGAVWPAGHTAQITEAAAGE